MTLLQLTSTLGNYPGIRQRMMAIPSCLWSTEKFSRTISMTLEMNTMTFEEFT